MPKRLIEGKTQEERAKIRKQLGTLKDLTVQPTTKARYAQARDDFYAYLKDHGLVLPHTASQLDSVVSDYLEFLWAEGFGRSHASNILAGLQDAQPQLRGKLLQSRRLLKTWSTHEVPNRAPPLPVDVLHAMVGYALFKEKQTLALSFLLAFHGLLRTGELVALKCGQVSISSPQGPAVISLGLTKGGKRQGAAESVTIYMEDICRRLFHWTQHVSPSCTLTGPAHKWRKEFAEILSTLGFSEWDFRPYSLRRGGATHLFSLQGSFDKLLVTGGWQSAKTAKLYLNQGLAVLAELRLPWTRFSRSFVSQYSRSLTQPLPSLEPVPQKAQSRGTRKQKHKRPKNVDLLARWCAVRGLFISPWEWPGKMLNKLVIPGLISPWVWPGVDRGIGI